MNKELLDRKAIRDLALKRDRHRRGICSRGDGLSVHHIFERKPFSDGGRTTWLRQSETNKR